MKHYEIRKTDDPVCNKVIIEHFDGQGFMDRNRSLWQKMFPGQLQKEFAVHELAQARTEFEFREKALKIARQSQIQAISEMYQDYLIRGKIPIRRERAEFVITQKIMLENRVTSLSLEFEANMVKHYELAEKIQIPSMKSLKFEMLDKTIENFFDLINELRENFRAILDEGVES